MGVLDFCKKNGSFSSFFKTKLILAFSLNCFHVSLKFSLFVLESKSATYNHG